MTNNKKSILPEIKTKLPGPKSKLILERYTKLFNVNMTNKMVANKAYGCIVEDVDGNKFLNFSELLCVAGYSSPGIVNASIEQTKKMIPRGPAAIPFLESAELLLTNLPGELGQGRVNFCVSGTETVELALSLARAYTKRPVIISYLGSHHGLIGNPNQISSDPRIKKYWTPQISNNIQIPYPTCYRCPFKHEYPECDLFCLEYLKNNIETVVIPEQVAGIILEPIQIHNGVFLPPDEYVTGIVDICKKHGIQLIFDEVFTGFGKSGKFLGLNYWNIDPDIVCLGKAMGGGFPLSAIVTKREVTDNTRKGGPLLHTRVTGSFAGNSVACIASIETMKYMEKHQLMKNAQKIGGFLMNTFRKFSVQKNSIGDIRGRGLLIGVDLVKDKETKEPAPQLASKIVKSALEKGLIIGIAGRHRNILGLYPPLTINLEQAKKAIEILEPLIN